MMENGNEWYWNLNLHRNRLMLNNSSSVTNKKMPISSATYTSAVLTDCGICVGMRNVNLKGASQLDLSKNQNIPNCFGNSSVVSKRNKQIWSAAYDQMRFSALSDPTMATQIHGTYFDLTHGAIKWKDPIPIAMECNKHDIEPCTSSLMSAELNPFHLFGDKSSLSSLNLNESHGYDYPLRAFHAINLPNNIKSSRDEMLTSSPMNLVPHFNYPYLTEMDDNYSRMQLNGYPKLIYSMDKSMSPRSNSPTFYSTNSTMKVAAVATNPNRRIKTNVSRQNHVVAPKKKWIRNYMKSNSHLWFSFNNYFRIIFVPFSKVGANPVVFVTKI